jgi:hypothetical protein
MKTLFSIVVLSAFFSLSGFAQEIKFEKTEIDYGSIKKSADGIREFKFTNTGKEPLHILTAKGSCGCTVPTYSKEAIKPGESSTISVKYDTERVGPFTKTVTLTTDAKNESTSILKITGTILAP